MFDIRYHKKYSSTPTICWKFSRAFGTHSDPFDQATKLSQQKNLFSVIKILTWLRGFRVKILIATFSRLHCLAIPRRDKENQSKHRKMTRKPRSHVRILIYRMWAYRLYWIINGLPIHELPSGDILWKDAWPIAFSGHHPLTKIGCGP